MIRFLFYFSISFLVLSIPINKKQLFYYLDQLTTSYTRPAFNKARTFIEKQLYERKVLGVKIIDLPKKENSKKMLTLVSESKKMLKSKPNQKKKSPLHSLDLNKKSEDLETEYYSESELLQLKEMLKNSDI